MLVCGVQYLRVYMFAFVLVCACTCLCVYVYTGVFVCARVLLVVDAGVSSFNSLSNSISHDEFGVDL